MPGHGITVTADSVAVNKGTLDTWYAPVNGQSASDSHRLELGGQQQHHLPGQRRCQRAGQRMVLWATCMSHDSTYKTRCCTPYANGGGHSGMVWMREKENGVWGDWNRD